MREIKFRYVYRQEVTGAIKTVEATLEQIEEHTDPTGPFSFVTDWIDNGYLLVDNVQYSGLKDKNGKEMWEGDLYKIEGNWPVYIVTFDDKTASFGLKSPSGPFYSFKSIQEREYILSEKLGNTYENPELLEEAK